MLSVNSNIAALFAANGLNITTHKLQDLSTHIAAGKRVLTASDDPAGLGILSNLKSQYASYNAVSKNLTAGQGLLSVSAAALTSQQSVLTQMKDLATQASSALLTANDRAALGATFTQLQNQLDDIVNKASVSGQNLTSSAGANVVIQSGIAAGNTTTLSAAKSDATTLAINAAVVDLTTTAKAQAAMTAIDTAINTVATNQSTIGAQQNLLKGSADYVKIVNSNTKAQISSIEDLDMAAASSELTMLQSQQQLSIQTLGIINSMSSNALALFR